MRATETVQAWVEDRLRSRELTVGMRLPAERALAEQLGVSRGSVREALQVLAAMGVVRRSVGSGDAAGAVLIAEPAAPLGSALRLHVATEAFPVRDVVETRVLLETWAVAAAARVTPAPDLTEVHELLDAMDDPDLDVRAFLRLDAQLHVALAARSGNGLVGQIMVSLRESIETYVVGAIPHVADWSALLDTLRAEHREVVAAVAAADPDAAARAVDRHIRGFYAVSGLAG
ncbi:FCD domain-containing protein [Nocardioides lentus]|uniref:FCD domain-containing protein n=1 Tax=Nocardioides lentus TaxID=338077 RepID=A0ABP5ANN7_9ACTN